MNKALKLMEILSENHSKAIPEKYAKSILQISTLEERINTLMSFGMIEKSKEIQMTLIKLLDTIVQEFKSDKNR